MSYKKLTFASYLKETSFLSTCMPCFNSYYSCFCSLSGHSWSPEIPTPVTDFLSPPQLHRHHSTTPPLHLHHCTGTNTNTTALVHQHYLHHCTNTNTNIIALCESCENKVWSGQLWQINSPPIFNENEPNFQWWCKNIQIFEKVIRFQNNMDEKWLK